MITLTIRKPILFLAILTIAAGVLAACTTGDDTQPGVTGSGATSVAASSGTSIAASDASEPTPVEVTFPMFPDGARSSTPVTGEAVLQFRSWPHDGYPVELSIYADGRVIWHPSQDDAGFFELRLTTVGVARIGSMVTSTGLFDHDVNLTRPGEISRLSILRGDRWVYVSWADASWWAGVTKNRVATASETRDLAELDRLLGDPSAWQLSSDLYADPEIGPFVPSGFMLDYDRSEPDLSQLPSPARELLSRHYPRGSACNIVTSEVAREILHALARAGFAPLTNTPTEVDYNLPGFEGHLSDLHLSPVLPDPCWSHM